MVGAAEYPPTGPHRCVKRYRCICGFRSRQGSNKVSNALENVNKTRPIRDPRRRSQKRRVPHSKKAYLHGHQNACS